MRVDHFDEDRFDCDRMDPGHLNSVDELFRQSHRYQLQRPKSTAGWQPGDYWPLDNDVFGDAKYDDDELHPADASAADCGHSSAPQRLEAAGLIGPHSVVQMKNRPPQKSSSLFRRVD
jgi:hypothetical protein